MNTRHILITLLTINLTIHAAPPPELTLLRQHYDKVVAERVTAPFDAALGTLNTKFTVALNKAVTDAQTAGNLPAVLAIEEDKKRIAGKLPLPDADDEQTPDSLKKLRAIYREQFKKLDDQRAANHNTILPGYTAKLQELEVTLTKAARVDEAKEIMTYRQELSLGMAATTPAPAATNGSTPAPEKTSAAKTNYPKGDDRKAAEWVLSVGGTVTLAVGGKETAVSDAPSLPRARFEVTKVSLSFSADKPPAVPITDLLPLAGLQGLRDLLIVEVKTLTDAHLAVLPSLPALLLFESFQGSFTDASFLYLANTSTLRVVNLRDQRSITGSGLAALAKLDSLVHLNVSGCPLSEAGIGELAQLTQLQVLFVDSTPFSDAHLPVLDGMRQLRDFQVKSATVTAAGIAGRKSLAGLKVLAMSLGAGDGVSQAGALAEACPVLDNLIITGRIDAPLTAEDIAELKAFPKLLKLKLYHPGIMEESVAGISALPKLQSLGFGYLKFTDACLPALVAHKNLWDLDFGEAQITDAGLLSLTKMKSLKRVKVNGCPKLTAAALAAFQKARPDVKVEK